MTRKATERMAGPGRAVPRVFVAATLVLLGIVSAASDYLLHPDSPYFDAPHLLTGGVMASLIAVSLIFLLRRGDKLIEQKRLMRRLVEASPEDLLVCDPDGRIILCSRQSAVVHGFESIDEVIGKNVFELIAEEERARARQEMQRMAQTGCTTNGQYTLLRKDGSSFPAEVSGSLVTDEEGSPSAFMGIVRDVTEPKRLADALKQNERQLAESQRIAHVGSFEFDIVTRTPTWSDELYRIFGFAPPPGGLGNPPPSFDRILESFHPEDRDAYFKARETAMEEKKPWTIDCRIVRSTGETCHIQVKGEYFYDPSGTPVLTRGTVQDITERKRMEVALRESEARFRRLAEQAEDLIYVYRLSPERGFEYVSPSAVAMTGYTPEEHYADPDLGFKLVHPDDRQKLEEARTAAGKPPVLTLRWKKKDGTTVWTEQRNVLIYDRAGNPVAIQGIARDITERKWAEADREKVISRLQEALDNVETLRGLIPICASCKKVRDDKGYWSQVESYLSARSLVEFSHGICPDCAQRLYPEFWLPDQGEHRHR